MSAELLAVSKGGEIKQRSQLQAAFLFSACTMIPSEYFYWCLFLPSFFSKTSEPLSYRHCISTNQITAPNPLREFISEQ